MIFILALAGPRTARITIPPSNLLLFNKWGIQTRCGKLTDARPRTFRRGRNRSRRMRRGRVSSRLLISSTCTSTWGHLPSDLASTPVAHLHLLHVTPRLDPNISLLRRLRFRWYLVSNPTTRPTQTHPPPTPPGVGPRPRRSSSSPTWDLASPNRILLLPEIFFSFIFLDLYREFVVGRISGNGFLSFHTLIGGGGTRNLIRFPCSWRC